MKFLLCILLTFFNSAWAIDNPDTPDYVAEFEVRIFPLENYINNKAMTTYEFTKGYTALNQALEEELSLVYANLMGKLPEKRKINLYDSQRQWLKYKDSELKFISEHFDRDTYGSSASISRDGYKSSMLTARIKQLLGYL